MGSFTENHAWIKTPVPLQIPAKSVDMITIHFQVLKPSDRRPTKCFEILVVTGSYHKHT